MISSKLCYYIPKGVVAELCINHSCSNYRKSCRECRMCLPKSKKMTLDTAKRIVDETFEWASEISEVRGLCLDLCGGEPLADITLIRDILDYIASKERTLKYFVVIEANDTKLSDKVFAILEKYQQMIRLSISNCGDRKLDFESICADIKKIKKAGIHCIYTYFVTASNVEGLSEAVKKLHRAGAVPQIRYADARNLDVGLLNKLMEELKLLVEFYSQNEGIVPADFIDFSIENLEEECNPYQKHICQLGEGYVFYDIDGKKYPCRRMSPLSNSKSNCAEMCTKITRDFVERNGNKCGNCAFSYACHRCAADEYQLVKKENEEHLCYLAKIENLLNMNYYKNRLHSSKISVSQKKQIAKNLRIIIDAQKDNQKEE